MTTAESPSGPREYGLIGRPPVFGLTRALGPAGTALVFGGMVLAALLIRVSPLAAGITVAVDATAIGLLSVRNIHHENGLTRGATRAGWWRTRRRRAHLYRAGTFGQIPHGRRQLPGIAAPTTVTEWRDSYDRPFAVVSMPATNDHAVVLTADPDGAALVDQEDVDDRVGRYARWLAGLGAIPGLVGATVIVEAAPDSGTRLRREVETNADPDAHPIAQAYLAEIVQTYSINANTVRGYVTLTFNGVGPTGRRTAEDMGRDLAVRLPGLTGGLAATGAGAVRPADAATVAEITHTAYDPTAATSFDAARAAGTPIVVPWEDTGPTAAQQGWEGYRHDSALSCTYEVTNMPAGAFREDLLADILAPNPDIDRKRVAILYRPLRPEQTTKAVDAAVNNAARRARRARATEVDRAQLEAATAVAKTVAGGAGLVNFSILITVTVTDPARLVIARAAIESMCAAARLTVHPAWGTQQATFAYALPLGLVPHRHLRVPAELREATR